MDWLQAFILGIVQGLTEFLPVSSSGHLEIGKALLDTEIKEDLTFTIVVHAATVLSTLVVFRKDINAIFIKSFEFKWNNETQYIFKILLSAVPVLIVGLFFEEQIEQFFGSDLTFVGSMLLVTALLLGLTYYIKSQNKKSISFKDAFIIGIAQAVAVLPGISRSGATIATSLLLKNDKQESAKFSFLMVLLPVLGKVFLDLISGDIANSETNPIGLIVGFMAAFISGLIACKLMIAIVKRSKLLYFAIYCAVVGIFTIVFL